jgi:hypothetical protein
MNTTRIAKCATAMLICVFASVSTIYGDLSERINANAQWYSDNPASQVEHRNGLASDAVATIGLTDIGLPGIAVDVLKAVEVAKTWEPPRREPAYVERAVSRWDGGQYADGSDGVPDAGVIIERTEIEQPQGFWRPRWEWVKEHPVLSASVTGAAGTAAYYAGEKQGWWGSKGTNARSGGDEVSTAGPTVIIGDGNSGISVQIIIPGSGSNSTYGNDAQGSGGGQQR